MTRMTPAELSRRILLQRVSCVAGAVTILGTGIQSARASKMSQAAVSYQHTPKSGQSCASCKQFQPPGSCRNVEGPINPQGWCGLYLKG